MPRSTERLEFDDPDLLAKVTAAMKVEGTSLFYKSRNGSSGDSTHARVYKTNEGWRDTMVEAKLMQIQPLPEMPNLEEVIAMWKHNMLLTNPWVPEKRTMENIRSRAGKLPNYIVVSTPS